MYFDVEGSKKKDFVFGKEGVYKKEGNSGSFNYRKAAKKRSDLNGKKCTICFTIKSLNGICINCTD